VNERLLRVSAEKKLRVPPPVIAIPEEHRHAVSPARFYEHRRIRPIPRFSDSLGGEQTPHLIVHELGMT
jgi:hypothetical protein